MPRVFLAEQLTAAVLERFAGEISAADACTCIDAPDSAVAGTVLRDPRWQPGNIPLWDQANQRVKDWIQQVAFAQPFSGPRALLERALIACALDARLRWVALGTTFFQHCRTLLGAPTSEVELDVVASDPYLVDGVRKGTWLGGRPRRLSVSGQPGISPVKRQAREWLTAQRWLRVPPWRRGSPAPAPPPPGNGKTVMVLAISLRSIKQLDRVLLELRQHGWRVIIVHHGAALPDQHMTVSNMDQTVVSFADASAGWRSPVGAPPRWELSEALMQESPVSRRWLDIALGIGWTTGAVQLGRHRQLLERWRPDAVFGYGPDLPNLALQVAAEELSIPTLYAPHGFEVTARTFYHFVATATPLYGPACAEANKVGPHGRPFPGLVPTGHPPYDLLVDEFQRTQGQRKPLPGLVPPPGRPHLVLGLAGWGFDLICHLHQERFLKMLAEALPPDAYLVCKLHPGFEERAFCEAMLSAGLPKDAFRVVGEAEFTTGALLAGCDVAVSNERSMVLTDAIVMGTPSVAITHPESPLGSGDRNHAGKDFSRNCRVVATSAELRAALDSLLYDPAAKARLLAERQAYLDRFVMGDGHATERVVALVEKLASP